MPTDWASRFVRSGKGANAGVHADDEPHALGCSACEHLSLHAVAVAQAMRDVKADGAAEDLDGGLKQDDGGGAVHVVVAVDEDRLACRDGLLDARDCVGHAMQSVGVEQMVERRMKEVCGFGRVGNTALEQQRSDGYGNAC